MTSKKRMQLVGLVALGVVTAILVVWSLPQIRNPQPTGVPAKASPTLTVGPSETPTASSGATPTPSKDAPTTAPKPTGVAGLATLLRGQEAVSILVLGDGSGNDPDEWVSLWATDYLAKGRKVAYKSWNPEREAWKSAGTTGSGPATTIWNASMTAPNLSTEDDRVADVWQPADVVIISYGHRNPASSIGSRLTAIRKAVKAQDDSANVIVMIQNPDPVAIEQTQREATQTVKKWAVDAGLDSINIYDAFIADSTPRYQLVEADGSPSPAGSALWARTLANAVASA